MHQTSHATTGTRAVRFLGLLVLCSVFSLVFAAQPQPARAAVSFGVSVGFGPPAIPYYVQPPAPDPNYIWSPGYWAYDGNSGGYYWVPGTWVPAPQPGLYWTPGYWGWNGNGYGWNPGYWGPVVGFYGGVNYGYGYYGNGYAGGRWRGNQFQYNTAISRVGGGIHSTYVDRGAVNSHWNRVSYNGGRGGIAARANSGQVAAARERRVGPTAVQTQHQTYAAQNRANYSSVNHGRPATVAVPRPYSAANRPVGARATAETARTTHMAAAHTATAHTATAHTATARTATVHTATATRSHAAPVAHTAPVAHAAPVARAQTEQRVAPQRMTLQRAAPAQRTYAAPPRAAAVPQRMAAPQRAMAAPARPAAAARPAAGPAQHAQGGRPPH